MKIRHDGPEEVRDYLCRVIQTRSYGSTYIPVGQQQDPPECEISGRRVELDWGYYGRSARGGGHKMKAYANWADTGTPVPSRMICGISDPRNR